MNLSVLIPTYCRVKDLTNCLEALKKQSRPPDQIVVTVRDTDTETQEFLAHYDRGTLPLESVIVGQPGVVAAMNTGLAQIRGEVFALTDDDTTPWEDWLARIEAHFEADPKVGGVGGRDWHNHERWDNPDVGRVQWFGRVIGNHHVGSGPPREVDLLKGANCAYRAAPVKEIGFDTRLRGNGAQVHWELSLGFAMKRRGWKLIYDPLISLDHHEGPRFDEDQLHRNGYNSIALENAAYNETIILLENFTPLQRAAFLTWSAVIGTKGEPGLLQLGRLLTAPRQNGVLAARGYPEGAGRRVQIFCKREPEAPLSGDGAATQTGGQDLLQAAVLRDGAPREGEALCGKDVRDLIVGVRVPGVFPCDQRGESVPYRVRVAEEGIQGDNIAARQLHPLVATARLITDSSRLRFSASVCRVSGRRKARFPVSR
jgi:GT2 family glycosyltransferase